MSDAFERSVRQAANDAVRSARPGSAETTSYHRAWRRGRRRRGLKQAAVAVSAAVVLVMAFTIPRLPGSSETDDVAGDVAVEVAPAATAETTEPTADTTAPTPALAGAPPAVPTTNAAAPFLPTATPIATPAAPPAQSPPRPDQIPPRATPGPLPNPVPTVAPAPTALPTLAVPTATPDPRSTAASSEPPPSRVPEQTPAGPLTTAAGPPERADASLRAPAGAGQIPCATTRGGEVDARCQLLVPYRCATAVDVRAGYELADLDGDGRPDTCTALNLTSCDTNDDGNGDTPCIIELEPEPPPGAPGGGG